MLPYIFALDNIIKCIHLNPLLPIPVICIFKLVHEIMYPNFSNNLSVVNNNYFILFNTNNNEMSYRIEK